MRLGPIFIVFLSSCATLKLPQAGERTIPRVDRQPRTFLSRTGVRVLVDSDPTNALVSLVTLVPSADPAGREGLSHLLSHLSLRALAGPGMTYAAAFEGAGAARFDVRPGFDANFIEIQGDRSTVARWLPLELQRLANPLEGVDEATFQLTRELVRNELRERREMVEGPDFEWLQKVTFPSDHPYSRSVFGSHKSLNALTLDDAKALARDQYRSDGPTVVVAGDISDALLASVGLTPVELVEKTTPTPAVVPPNPPITNLLEEVAGVSHPTLYLTWSLPAGYSDFEERVRIMAEIASEGLQAARGHDEDVMGLSARVVPGARASLLIVTVDLFAGTHPARSMEHVLNYLINLDNVGAVGDLQARRDLQFGIYGYNESLQRLYELENSLTRARTLATDWVYSGRLSSVPWHTSRSYESRVFDRLFRTWMTRDRARGVLVRPAPANTVAAVESVVAAPPVSRPTIANDALTSLENSVDSLTPVTQTLANGLQVVVVRNPGWPVVSVALAHGSGSATGPVGAAELAQRYAVPRLLTYGTPYNYALTTRTVLESDLKVLEFTGRARNLANILAQLSVSLISQHVDSQLQVQLSRYEYPFQRLHDALPERVAQRELLKTLLPSSRLGVLPVTEDIERLDESEVSRWANSASPEGSALVIVGDVDPEQALADAKTWLESWSRAAPAQLSEPPRPAPTTLKTVRPGASQGRVRLACRVDGTSPRARATGHLLAELLRIETNEAVREEKGLTAGVDSVAKTVRGGTAYVELVTLLDATRLRRGVDELQSRVGAIDVSSGLERARWAAARQISLERDDSAGLATSLARGLVRGYSQDELFAPVKALRQVSAEDVSSALASCRASEVVSVLADESALKQLAP